MWVIDVDMGDGCGWLIVDGVVGNGCGWWMWMVD